MAKLYGKYSVYREGRSKVSEAGYLGCSVDVNNIDSPFVLLPRKDPAAMAALKCYARNCEAELADSIKRWLAKVRTSPEILGTQGKRNAPFAKKEESDASNA